MSIPTQNANTIHRYNYGRFPKASYKTTSDYNNSGQKGLVPSTPCKMDHISAPSWAKAVHNQTHAHAPTPNRFVDLVNIQVHCLDTHITMVSIYITDLIFPVIMCIPFPSELQHD